MKVNRLWVEAQGLHNRDTTSAQMQHNQIGCPVDSQGLLLRDAPRCFTSTAVSWWIIPTEWRNSKSVLPTLWLVQNAWRECFVTFLGKLGGELLWNDAFSLQEQSLKISYKILTISVSNPIILSKKKKKKIIASCRFGNNITLREWLWGQGVPTCAPFPDLSCPDADEFWSGSRHRVSRR